MSGRDLLSSVAAGAALVALVASCKGDGFAYQTTYTFNTRLASALYADKESGAWVDRRRVEYRYDEDGHLVGVTREEHIDGVWRATGSAELEWNDDGHLARVVKLRFLGERTGGEEWSFAYDERGNLVREDKRVRLDSKLESTWIDAGTFENRYDGDDRLEERVGYAPSGEDAAPAEVLRVTFARGSDGALEEEIDRIREASSWIDDVRYTLSYDAGAIDAVITHHVHEEAWVAGN